MDTTLNMMLRGASLAMLALIAAALLRDHPRLRSARLGAAFALGVGASILATAPGFMGAPVPAYALAGGLAAGNMVVFWLFTRSLFDDGFSLRAGGDGRARRAAPGARPWARCRCSGPGWRS
ncbi:MAG: hypothetical protein MO847_03285 [Candidatus Protistobacter heckmanni]|nr:hypothetical protein [Candidatus Protistobacter heckmanni]